MTYELLVGTDGANKMAKSEGNYIGIDERPDDMFGKVMSIPDEALEQWWRLDTGPRAARRRPDGVEACARARQSSSCGTGRRPPAPRRTHFTRVVREGKPPEEIEEAELPLGEVIHLPALLVERFGIASTSEARRLIAQGGAPRRRRAGGGARPPARAAGRTACSSGKAPLPALPRRLTVRRRLLLS